MRKVNVIQSRLQSDIHLYGGVALVLQDFFKYFLPKEQMNRKGSYMPTARWHTREMDQNNERAVRRYIRRKGVIHISYFRGLLLRDIADMLSKPVPRKEGIAYRKKFDDDVSGCELNVYRFVLPTKQINVIRH